jgi:hypothetical protein
VCRLYDDTHDAFLSGVIANHSGDNGYQEFRGSGRDVKDVLTKIPVPSRLYKNQSELKPLAGVSLNFILRLTVGLFVLDSVCSERHDSSARPQNGLWQ